MADLTTRDIIVSYRITAAEAAHLDAAGQALNQPRQRADFARAAALHAAKARVPEPPRAVRRPGRRKPPYDVELLAKILGQVGQVSRTLEQVAKAANGETAIGTRTLAGMTTDIIQIRNAVRAALDGGHHDDGQEDGDGH